MIRWATRLAMILLVLWYLLNFVWAVFYSVAINTDEYLRIMKSLSVQDAAGISEKDLERVVMQINRALTSGYPIENVDVTMFGEQMPFFNEKEIQHMDDIVALRILIPQVFRMTTWIAPVLVFFIAFTTRWRGGALKWEFVKGYKLAVILLLGSVGGLALWAAIDFTSAFTFFHHIFFRNDLWLLDPRTDMLIRIMPQQFFVELGMIILRRLTWVLVGVAAIWILLDLVQRRGKRKEKAAQ